MTNMDIISKEQREALAGRVEVLDKVKELLLLPQVEMVTMQQVADYYEVDHSVIQSCYNRHKKEVDSDDTVKLTCSDARARFFQNARIVKTKQYQDFYLDDGTVFRIPNTGIRMFSKRAVLRLGMLLRDSRVAQEVRTQLLNVAEAADTTQRVQAIDDEKDLIFDMGKALASQDYMEVAKACNAYIQFQNRHIAAVEESNKALGAANAMLAKQELTWEPRSVVNRLVRLYSSVVFGCDFRLGWSDYYRELKYRKGIALQMRTGKGTALDRLHEDEWRDAIAVAAALCQENGLDPAAAMNATNAAVYLTEVAS